MKAGAARPGGWAGPYLPFPSDTSVPRGSHAEKPGMRKGTHTAHALCLSYQGQISSPQGEQIEEQFSREVL